jgi:predicted transposase YbfD/YdcC
MDVQADGGNCASPVNGFLRFFADIPDPRGCNIIHKLSDILVLAFCGVICGADGWVEVETFCNAKLTFFKTFLELPAGIPSHDTFGRVFSVLDPNAFEQRFTTWMKTLATGGKLIAIDGKSIRRSFAHAWDKSGMAHLVSAFVAANKMVFAQIAVADKENEIVAIPKLLELLDLRDSVVTIDAMGCQRQIAAQITAGGGDYVLAVKDNQPTLNEKVRALMDEARLDSFKEMRHGVVESSEGGHGRIEIRRVWVTDEVEWIKLDQPWPGLASLAMVETTREILGAGEKVVHRRYYISSLKGIDATAMAQHIRGHWSVENNLHWQLDVSFREDERRIRKGYAAENFSRLTRIALNRLKSDKTAKVGINTKRMKAGWDDYYLFKLLTT